jgi:hypothetical protein
MTLHTLLLTAGIVGMTALAPAQPADQPSAPQPRTQAPQPRPPAAAPQVEPPRRERPTGQAVNIKVDVTITDQHSGAPPLKKTVSVVTGDAMSGFIRSQATYSAIGEVPLNIDTEPFLLPDGKIRLRVNLQYDLPGSVSPQGEMPIAGTLRRTAIRENLALILESGKALVAAQSADPVGDRQVTIEVKATVLR